VEGIEVVEGMDTGSEAQAGGEAGTGRPETLGQNTDSLRGEKRKMDNDQR
jgi:hypothetical protein